MIRYYERFDTEDEAEKYRDDLYAAYHPAGYSTHVQIRFDTVSKKWIAWGGRAESCD